jgi:hypothetical protein
MQESGLERTEGCRRFDLELSAHLEGENRPFVSVHTKECVFCRVLLEDLDNVRVAAKQLRLEEPSPLVWANLRAHLRQEGVIREEETAWSWLGHWRAHHQLAPVGALACLVILGSILTAPQTSLLVQGPPHPDIGPVPVLEELEKTFKANEQFLAPEVRDAYDKSLVSLDDSILECRNSLQQEPGNSLAHEYLIAAYSRKAEVLASALESAAR